jgi:hypothetical protein
MQPLSTVYRDARAVVGMCAPILPLLIPLPFAAIVLLEAPRHAAQGFYGPAADVGIVLLVAVAIEARLLPLRGLPAFVITDLRPEQWLTDKRANLIWRSCMTFHSLTIAAILIGTEVDILFVLARDTYARADVRIILSSLTFGIIAVVLAGLLARSTPNERSGHHGN